MNRRPPMMTGEARNPLPRSGCAAAGKRQTVCSVTTCTGSDNGEVFSCAAVRQALWRNCGHSEEHPHKNRTMAARAIDFVFMTVSPSPGPHDPCAQCYRLAFRGDRQRFAFGYGKDRAALQFDVAFADGRQAASVADFDDRRAGERHWRGWHL